MQTQGVIIPTSASVSELPASSIINKPLSALEGSWRRDGRHSSGTCSLGGCSFIHFYKPLLVSTERRSLAGPKGNRITHAFITESRRLWRQMHTHKHLWNGLCLCSSSQLQLLQQPKCFLFSNDKNGIIRPLCYHKYNLRKACGPVSFVWKRASYSGEAVSSISRFEKKTLNLQQTARVQVPALHCVTLYKLIYISEPISMLENGSFHSASLWSHAQTHPVEDQTLLPVAGKIQTITHLNYCKNKLPLFLWSNFPVGSLPAIAHFRKIRAFT